MSIATNPLLSAIVLEGINQAGEMNPSPALITRATNNWIEEIKNDIWNLGKKPKLLQITSYTVIPNGQSRYAYPDDYSSDLSLTLITGKNTNACQGGSTNSVTLNSADTSGANIIGKEILMTSGASQGSYSQIVSYDTTTKTALVVPDFNASPIAGDSYMMIDIEYPVETRPIFDWEARTKFIAPGLPQYLYPVGDDESGYFVLNCPPNALYGARLRYYADISQVDSTSELMSVIYRKWRMIFIKGIKWKKLMDEDDDNADTAGKDYMSSLRVLIYREAYGMDISNLTDRIVDFDFGHLDNYGGGSGTR